VREFGVPVTGQACSGDRFRKLGFIKYNGKLSVHSSLLNIIHND